MPIASALRDFKARAQQCDSLIANAHQSNQGTPMLPARDREQITEAAFLNLFIAWEGFLEETLAHFMVGAQTLNGSTPVRYASPPSIEAAKKMAIGTMKYFDYANHDHFRKFVIMYFQNGYPFEPQIRSILTDLSDLKTIRNSCAHISSSTQTALDALIIRIFGRPILGGSVYRLLTSRDPRSSTGETIFISYRKKLEAAAEMIARG